MFGIRGLPSDPYTITILLATSTSADTRITVPFLNFDNHYVFTKHTTVSLATTIHQNVAGKAFKGIEIHSDVPIWVAVLIQNANRALFEGFLLQPLLTFSTQYIVASFAPYSVNNSGFLITGTQKDTTVFIEFPGTFPAPNENMSVQLQRFETFLYQSRSDVSGAVISSDKPITVISGSSCSQIGTASGCQYIAEQMPPVDFYDFNYIVPPVLNLRSYYVRLFSAYDDTEVSRFHGKEHNVRYLNEYEYIEELFDDQPVFIQGSKPIMVMIYSTNHFMLTAQAMAQYQSDYEFLLQASTAPNTIVVTILERDLPGLYLDGSKTDVDGAHRVNISIANYNYTILYLNIRTESIHRVHHSGGRKFGAFLYALPDASYGFGMQVGATLTDNSKFCFR